MAVKDSLKCEPHEWPLSWNLTCLATKSNDCSPILVGTYEDSLMEMKSHKFALTNQSCHPICFEIEWHFFTYQVYCKGCSMIVTYTSLHDGIASLSVSPFGFANDFYTFEPSPLKSCYDLNKIFECFSDKLFTKIKTEWWRSTLNKSMKMPSIY